MTKKTVRRGKVRMSNGASHGEVLLSPESRAANHGSDEFALLRSAFDTCAERISKDLEAAQQEVRRLSRRVQHLEQLVKQRAHAATAAMPMRVSPSPAGSLFTFLGRPNPPFVELGSSSSRV